MLKHIILFLTHWDKEALRQVNTRFYDLIVNDVTSLEITRQWVDFVVKRSKIRCLKSAKYPAFERRERKERMVTLYISRHRNLRTLHFYQSGLSFIHRDTHWQKYFTKKLAGKCLNIEELLVQGTSGLKLALKYAKKYHEMHASHCKISSLLIDPYQAAALFCPQMKSLVTACPDLLKLTFISELNYTNFSRALVPAQKMLQAFCDKVKYFATDFTGDFTFKLSAIDTLDNLSGLTLCRSRESVNKHPFQPAHLETINSKNGQLHRLRVPVTGESIYTLKQFKNLTELSLVISCQLTQSLFRDVFRSIGCQLTLLSLTFAPTRDNLSGNESEFDVTLDFSLCTNLNILSIQGRHSLQFDQLLGQLGANCRMLNEIYYSRYVKDAFDLLNAIEKVTSLCPSIRLVVVNDVKYKGKDGLLWRREGDASNSCEQLEKRVFY